MRLVNIGYGNMVMADRIIAIVSEKSAPIKRMIQEARENGNLIDATYGRRNRAVIITDSRQIILSPVQPETIAGRLEEKLPGGAQQAHTEDEAEEKAEVSDDE